MTRNMVGYGASGPNIRWPNQAKIAVNFVINYEEGAERCPLHGDETSEIYGTEFPLLQPPPNTRSLNMESLFEYGSRTGIWRLVRLFDRFNVPLTFFVTGFALEQNPAFAAYLKDCDHEVAGHGWRWIDYAGMPKAEEQKHIDQCVKTITKLTGKPPVGWYTGRRSENTLDLIKQHGHFRYNSDSYADDCPYFEDKFLIIPYSLVTNDFRFTFSPGFVSPDDFFQTLKNSFDCLYQENRTGLLSIGLHARLSGQPARAQVLQQFIEYMLSYPDVWVATRQAIAEHWMRQ